jgi:hypothetical protein
MKLRLFSCSHTEILRTGARRLITRAVEVECREISGSFNSLRCDHIGHVCMAEAQTLGACV